MYLRNLFTYQEMKKTLVIFFSVFTSLAFGQFNFTTTWPSRFRIGVEGGVGLVSQFGNPVTEKSQIIDLGYNGGVTFQWDFNPVLHPDSTTKSTIRVGLKTGVYYDRKGSVVTPKSAMNAGLPVTTSKTRTILNYITVPLLVQLSVGRENRVRCYQMLGPYFSYLQGQHVNRSAPDSGMVESYPVDYYKKLDIGIIIGIGLEIPIKQQFYINAEFRQCVGLFDINSNAQPAGEYIQTNASQFYIGFAYRFARKKPYKDKLE